MDFRGADVSTYQEHRLAEDRKPNEATINRELAILARGFNLAFEQGLVDFQSILNFWMRTALAPRFSGLVNTKPFESIYRMMCDHRSIFNAK